MPWMAETSPGPGRRTFFQRRIIQLDVTGEFLWAHKPWDNPVLEDLLTTVTNQILTGMKF